MKTQEVFRVSHLCVTEDQVQQNSLVMKSYRNKRTSIWNNYLKWRLILQAVSILKNPKNVYFLYVCDPHSATILYHDCHCTYLIFHDVVTNDCDEVNVRYARVVAAI